LEAIHNFPLHSYEKLDVKKWGKPNPLIFEVQIVLNATWTIMFKV